MLVRDASSYNASAKDFFTKRCGGYNDVVHFLHEPQDGLVITRIIPQNTRDQKDYKIDTASTTFNKKSITDTAHPAHPPTLPGDIQEFIKKSGVYLISTPGFKARNSRSQLCSSFSTRYVLLLEKTRVNG